jgi:hypothetical protein
MPDLNTTLHLDMLRRSGRRRNLVLRILRAVKREWCHGGIYGLEWGDPDVVQPLRFIRDRYVLPYVNAEQCAVEIGPGGGRWTRYMLGFRKLYVVDYYADVLEEMKKNVRKRKIEFIKNNGTDFPGIDERSVNYHFPLVHLCIWIRISLRRISVI